MKSLRLILIAPVAVLALSACGSSSIPGMKMDATTAAPKAAGSATAAGTFKDGDVTFAQGMIPHHEQAIEMADMALDPNAGASAAVKTLATKIKAGQDPEIKQMTALLTSWGKPVAMEMSGAEMSTMEGMMSSKDMTSLGTLKGAGFDKAWATMMIAHHKGAIKMAETVKTAGSNPDMLKLAAGVITAQQAEITQLQPIAG